MEIGRLLPRSAPLGADCHGLQNAYRMLCNRRPDGLPNVGVVNQVPASLTCITDQACFNTTQLVNRTTTLVKLIVKASRAQPCMPEGRCSATTLDNAAFHLVKMTV